VKRSEVIALAQSITENKLVGQVDLNALYFQALQEFCGEKRFWWRKKNLSFSTTGGTATYDLSTATPVTVPAGAGAYIEEITKIVLIDGSDVCELDPITDDEAVAGIILDATNSKPAGWTVDSGDLELFQKLRLSPIPNGTYTVRVFFWAMPNADVDQSSDTIYVVPKPLHHCLVTALEKEIWRIAYGVQDPKYKTALDLYNKKVAMAAAKPSFWSGASQFFTSQSGEAITSTR
jgi:hypothetical protein